MPISLESNFPHHLHNEKISFPQQGHFEIYKLTGGWANKGLALTGEAYGGQG